MSRQAITKWESGKGMPDINNIFVKASFYISDNSNINLKKVHLFVKFFCYNYK